MSGRAASPDDVMLEGALAEVQEAGSAFVVDLGTFEGPLHVLLSLARDQKVDLTRISILKLAEQYLVFIGEARSKRIDLAADYLVMAAWLAWLKSRLLLPRRERAEEGPAPDDLAAHLAWRLKRLDAMRAAADALYERPRTGLDVFVRGEPEEIAVTDIPLWQADLIDLLRAYGRQRTRTADRPVHRVRPWPVWPVEEARRRIETELPKLDVWRDLGALAPGASDLAAARARGQDAPSAASRYASLVSASLELAKQGRLDLRQLAPFDPLFIKGRSAADTSAGAAVSAGGAT
jgi:segregation and condensation protein A